MYMNEMDEYIKSKSLKMCFVTQRVKYCFFTFMAND